MNLSKERKINDLLCLRLFLCVLKKEVILSSSFFFLMEMKSVFIRLSERVVYVDVKVAGVEGISTTSKTRIEKGKKASLKPFGRDSYDNPEGGREKQLLILGNGGG